MKKKIFLLLTFLTINLNAQVTDVLTTGLTDPAGLAISGNTLFIAESFGADKISKIDISSASPTKIDVVSGLSGPDGLAINGNTLYIAETNADRISKIDISSATPIVETVITNVLEPTGIVIDGNYLYIAEYNANKISKLNLTTLVKTDYLTGISGPTGLVISNNILYFSDFDTNVISKVDLTAAMPVITQLSSGFDEPASLNLVGSELYIANYGSGKLSKMNITNQVVSDVAPNLGGVYGLVNNGAFLFLSQRDTNKISKISLPNLSTVNFDIENQASVYPNPVSNYLTLKNVLVNSNITISDFNGRIIKQFIYQKPTIDLQSLEKGIYFLTINKNKTIKFIKN
ncbi:T9SS type A sorting domain-containing protein [Chryseobacterium sp. C-71]|uniref:T9SS type A sorting domain-containing protein n=1 Tax=Chryseobacterium sp. C-71 TaxID=2893882 RepID=UPI001E608578|nr:T9SS type A sorting domain-containing protein [Chryseobacterium sp. C-71]UFH30880.1 T9SS type A sorting domain-containing protein [Chryseobacterium sp. C-71]